MNTGAEAVETAIKAARKWAYINKGVPQNKAEIIVVDGNFHGRTTTIVSFSSDESYKKDFGPLTPGFVQAKYCSSCACPVGDCVDSITSIKNLINENTAAILIEPIQGEAGIIVPRQGWLKAVRELCNRTNILLLVDEIQSGLGRTGSMFAFEHEDIKPDGLIVGKALGGGILPVSAFIAKQEIMDNFVHWYSWLYFRRQSLSCSSRKASFRTFSRGRTYRKQQNTWRTIEDWASINWLRCHKRSKRARTLDRG